MWHACNEVGVNLGVHPVPVRPAVTLPAGAESATGWLSPPGVDRRRWRLVTNLAALPGSGLGYAPPSRALVMWSPLDMMMIPVFTAMSQLGRKNKEKVGWIFVW